MPAGQTRNPERNRTAPTQPALVTSACMPATPQLNKNENYSQSVYDLSMNASMPPGWYTNQYGQHQWWDGQQWGPLAANQQPPPPDNLPFNAPNHPPAALAPQAQYAGAPARRESGTGWAWGCLGVFILFALIIGSCTAITSSSTSADRDRRDTQQTQQAQPNLSTDYLSEVDRLMAEEGYEPWERGYIYVRVLSDEEKQNLSCGYGRCAWVAIVALDGCPGGIYVEVDLTSNGTPVDWTNAISASAQPEEEVIVELNTFNENSDAFRISDITCM